MTDEEFARLFEAVGAAETSRRLGMVHVVGPDEVEFRGKLWTV